MSLKIDVMDDQMADILRRMTGAERLQIANRMFVSARRMIASHLAAEHPDWTAERIEKETARRISHADDPSEQVWQELQEWLDRQKDGHP